MVAWMMVVTAVGWIIVGRVWWEIDIKFNF